MPGLANTLFTDYRQRPLGLLLVRLLWELGVLSHEPGAPKVPESLLDADGNVRIRFSVESPWGSREVAPGVIDEFLTQAMAVGDGVPVAQSHPELDPEPWGAWIQRYLSLTSRDLSQPAWRSLWSSPETPLREMVFAFTDGDTTLRLVNVGHPLFEDEDLKAASPVHPLLPFAGFPVAFERPDGTRFYLPGSEAGGELNLTGYVFLRDGREVLPLARRLEKNGDPVIRVHMTYTPGWETACGGVYAWSEIGEGTRNALRNRFTVIEG
jgi:hypothetical protein